MALATAVLVTTLGDPESREAAAADAARRTYLRGSILDRDGNVLSSSSEVMGTRTYNGGAAFGSVVGYYSKNYGTSGLEAALDVELTTSDSKSDDKRGHDITLTLDPDVQQTAYQQLINAGVKGAAVALDVKSGEILALASTPSYDPSRIDTDWAELTQINGLFLPNAYKQQFAPGSTFKTVSSIAVVDNGLYDTRVQDDGSVVVNGQTIENYAGRAYGSIGLNDAIRVSSNVYFIKQALSMGESNYKKTLDKLLIGQNIQLDFTTLKSSYNTGGGKDDNALVSTAFGQGETAITPLHMAMTTQTIANGGKMLRPYMIKGMTNAKGESENVEGTKVLSEVTSQDTCNKVTEAMVGAAEHYGYSYVGAQGWQLAAKTGTAQVGDGTSNGWIVSFAPANDPKYAVIFMAREQDEFGGAFMPNVSRIYDALSSYDYSREDN